MGTDAKITSEHYQVNNNDFSNSSALDLRLRHDPIISKVYNFLTGKRPVEERDYNGDMRVVLKAFSRPKMNDEGAEMIIARLELGINASVLQGNWERKFFHLELKMLRESIAYDIMLNLDNWEVLEENYESIVDGIMLQFAGALSRPIDNKERESFTNTLKTVESSSSKTNEVKL